MESIRVAFSQRPDLQQRITDVTVKHPSTKPLFEDIAQHVAGLQGSKLHNQPLSLNQADHPSKKRKLESTIDAANWGIAQSYSDISFSIPVRKKLKLVIGTQLNEGLLGKSGDAVEVSASWSTVRNVFCLPVPEKAQAQYNFCIIKDDPEGKVEQILWTVPEAVPKDGIVSPLPPSGLENSTYRTQISATITTALKKYGIPIMEPNEAEFASQITQAHRKSEKAYHVKAFRGSKDGFLFFLSTGIFWGFKKPLEFFPFDVIDSVSYTSVLQRTFNLNIIIITSTRVGDDTATAAAVAEAEMTQELEFSMIDQVDFAGIDAYVRRHHLEDASMAEQRRAKRVNVNSMKRGAAGAEDGEGEGAEGELAKAAREAQDIDDEEEEDDENFDPGSEGESEGEGSASDEDEDGDEAGGQRDGDDEEEEEEEEEEGEEEDEL